MPKASSQSVNNYVSSKSDVNLVGDTGNKTKHLHNLLRSVNNLVFFYLKSSLKFISYISTLMIEYIKYTSKYFLIIIYQYT